MTRLPSLASFGAVCFCFALAMPAQADVYSFTCISSEVQCIPGGTTGLADQFTVNIGSLDDGQGVRFEFWNIGTIASSITGIYFQDTNAFLLPPPVIENGPGVQFSVGGTWAYDEILSLAHSRGVGGINISAAQTGNALGDFMLGRLTEMRQSMPSTNSPSQQYLGLYAQDTWKLTRTFTLDYGLRWDYFTYLREQHGRAPQFSPTTPSAMRSA